MLAWRLFLAAHGAAGLAAAWTATLVLAVVVSDQVLVLDVGASGPARALPAIELLAVFLAATAPVVVRPRLWSWESRERRGALRLRAASLGVAAILAPASLPGLVSLLSPTAGASCPGVAWNVALVASVAALVTIVVSPRLGAPLALLCYLGLIVLQQSLGGAAEHVPLARVRTDLTGDPGGDLPPATLLVSASVAAAVVAWGLTLGRARASYRRARNN